MPKTEGLPMTCHRYKWCPFLSLRKKLLALYGPGIPFTVTQLADLRSESTPAAWGGPLLTA